MSASEGMRALILVGGFGTRLRPLTLSTPKPLVPFCNKPMIIHQVIALKEAGVTDIILAVAYRPDLMKEEMDAWAKELGVNFIFSHETEPLGTAGPLALARDELMKDDKPFFVLNSDVTCCFPLRELLAFHNAHGGEGTILATKVEDPSKYGVIVYDEKDGKIQRFVEKPKQFVGNKINAGIYVLSKSVLARIPLAKTSIETQVFPAIAKDEKLYCMELPGFWMDIGQPHDYIAGLSKKLDSLAASAPSTLFSAEAASKAGFVVIGNVLIDPTAKIAPGAVLGPDVTIGANCVVGPSARLINTAVFDDTTIGQGTYIHTAIIGWKCAIGAWCRIVNNTVFGEDVSVKNEVYCNGIKVLPNKGINQSYDKPEIVM